MLFLRACQGVTPSRLRRLTAAFVIVSISAVSSALAPKTASAKPPKKTHGAMVRVETALLRSGPGTNHKATGMLDAGRKARVVGRRDGWLKVKLATGTEGWVRSDLLNVSRKATRDSVEASRRSVARRKHEEDDEDRSERSSRKRTNVAKAQPAPKKKPVAVAKAKPAPEKKAAPAKTKPAAEEESEKVATTEISRNDRFLRGSNVNLRSSALVAAASIRRAATQSKAEATRLGNSEVTSAPVQVAMREDDERDERAPGMLRSALAYRGTPYRMGARGNGAFDCSGFTQFIFAKSGKSLPRTAEEQSRRGQKVDRDHLQAGDLVFFKNTYKRGVSHVGIYMGDGKFVHASSRGGVRTNSLSEAYYVNHWAWGARIP